MKPLRPLVRTICGSNLHGTTTPQSDVDHKAVHLPAGEDILLQRSEVVHSDSVISKNDDGSNRPDAIDHESYSLYKFARMVARGDIVALEVLFTPDEFIIEQAPEWPTLRDDAKMLLNSQAAGFVAYAVREANRYSIKIQRVNALEGLIDILKDAILEHGPKTRAEVVRREIEEYAAETDYTSYKEEVTHKTAVPVVTCCERSMHLTSPLSEVLKLYEKTLDKYGHRTKSAKDDGYNWKSLSHAVRLARQAYELITTRSITFPRPDAEELLAIKLGQVSFEKVEAILIGMLGAIENAPSILPAETSDEAIDAFVLAAYRTQIS